MLINKALLEHSHTQSSPYWLELSSHHTAELNSCSGGLSVPQSLQYLLSGRHTENVCPPLCEVDDSGEGGGELSSLSLLIGMIPLEHPRL